MCIFIHAFWVPSPFFSLSLSKPTFSWTCYPLSIFLSFFLSYSFAPHSKHRLSALIFLLDLDNLFSQVLSIFDVYCRQWQDCHYLFFLLTAWLMWFALLPHCVSCISSFIQQTIPSSIDHNRSIRLLVVVQEMSVTLLVLLTLFSSDPVVWLQRPYWNLERKVFIIKRANSLRVWNYLYFQQPSLSSSFQSSPNKLIFFSGPGPLTVFQIIQSFSHFWVCLNECLAPSSASTKSQSYIRSSTSVSFS